MGKRKIPDVRVSPKESEPKVLSKEETLSPNAIVETPVTRPSSKAGAVSAEQATPERRSPPPRDTSRGSPQQKDKTKLPDYRRKASGAGLSWLTQLIERDKLLIKVGTMAGVLALPLAIIALILVVNSSPTVGEGALPIPGESLGTSGVSQSVTVVDHADPISKSGLDSVWSASLGMALLDLSRALQTGNPFDKEVSAVRALNGDQDNQKILTLISFVESYALSGVPTLTDLEGLLALVEQEVAIYSGTKSDTLLGTAITSLRSFIDSDVKNAVEESDRAKAIFSVTRDQIKQANIEGAITALSHLEGASREVVQSYIDLLRRRLTVDRSSAAISELALSQLSESRQRASSD